MKILYSPNSYKFEKIEKVLTMENVKKSIHSVVRFAAAYSFTDNVCGRDACWVCVRLYYKDGLRS